MQSERRTAAPDLAFIAAGIATVVGIAVLVATGRTVGFDGPIIDALRSAALRGPLGFLRPLTELGSTAAVSCVAVGVLALGLVLGALRNGLAGAITITLASVGNSGLKLAIARARPDALDPIIVERGFSFPSGHAALSMVAYGVLAVVVARSSLPPAIRVAVAAGLGALVALIGISRVWLGVHYPTDVVAGWIAGAVVVVAYAAVTRAAWPGRAAGPAAEGPGTPRSDPPAAP